MELLVSGEMLEPWDRPYTGTSVLKSLGILRGPFRVPHGLWATITDETDVRFTNLLQNDLEFAPYSEVITKVTLSAQLLTFVQKCT